MNWLTRLVSRRRLYGDLSAEIEEHLNEKIDELVAGGMSREEAAQAARREFGNVTLLKERSREVWQWPSIESFVADIRFALRMLRKSPGFTAVAILTLALGIGANTAIFSVVNGVLLNPLPYPHPNQLVTLAGRTHTFPESAFSYPNFLDWQRENHTFEALAAYRQQDFDLIESGEAERVSAMMVSASFFPLLGVKPVIGRTFRPEEDQLNGPPVIVLSGGFWARKFGSSPEIVGKTITLDGTACTVVGVIPTNFYFSGPNFRLGDVYMPLGASKNPWVRDRGASPGINGIGRLKPGVTLSQARADMDGIARDLAAAYPEANKGVSVAIAPLKTHMVRNVQPILLVLLAAVGLVLLIACVNVANLLLARSTGRAREFAIRAALGAKQGRVIRQLLTESLLLAVAGGGFGLLLAAWGTEAALEVLPEALPRANDVRLDSHVLIFTLVVSILAGVLFGLAPALKTSHPDLQETLKEGGRGASGARHRTQDVFIVVEMALAVVLLIGAGLTIRSLMRLWSVNPGFDPHNVLTFIVGVPPSMANATPVQIRAEVRELNARIAEVPGVSAVSLMAGATPMHGDQEIPLWLEGQPKPASEERMDSALWYMVGPDYLKVMKIPLLRGRFLTPQDDEHSARVCVIDDDFARRYFGSQNPIGKRINLIIPGMQLEIVGVVGHVKQWGLDEKAASPVQAQLYASPIQLPDGIIKSAGLNQVGWIIRTQASPLAVAGSIRNAIRRMNSQQVVFDIESMDEIISDSLAARRFTMILLTIFAAQALVLASIGIYGVISYVAGQRAHEIGIRLALGAQQQDVLRLVLGQAARMTLLGVIIGLTAAAGLTRVMKTMLFGVSAIDPVTFAGVAIVLTLVALTACYIPARRAMRVDPIVALRYE